MKKDIIELIGVKKSREQSLIDEFERIVKKVDTKEDIRKIEMRLLRPRPFLSYKGRRPGKSTFKKKSITLTFPTSKNIETWAKYFRVNKYVENNTYDIDFIIEIFRLLESGRVKWNREKKKYYLITKDKRKIRI